MAASASAWVRPPEPSFARTSEKFTALIAAPTRCSGSNWLNSSSFSSARMAEASATTSRSFTPRLFPPLGDQFRHEIAGLGNAPCDDALCGLDGLAAGPQPQLALTDQLDQELVAGLDTRRRATFRRDHNAALLVDPRLAMHDTISSFVTSSLR